MPAGPAALGFVYFAAAKFAGYTAFCRWGIEPQIDSTVAASESPTDFRVPSAWKAGAVRTAIGLGIGAVVGLGFWSIPYFATHDAIAEPLFFVGLVPVRVFEWWLLLHWIYGATPLSNRARLVLIVVGVIVSFALDVLGIASAFVLPGGMWVC